MLGDKIGRFYRLTKSADFLNDRRQLILLADKIGQFCRSSELSVWLSRN